MYVKFFGQEIAFANIDKTLIEEAVAVCYKQKILNFNTNHESCKTKYLWYICSLQYASGPSIQKYGREALQTLLLSGLTFTYAKPVLAAEVRRIFPTAAGLPMELSLYSAAVAGGIVKSEYNNTIAIIAMLNKLSILR